MNDHQIECFLTVSKYLNFSKAAEILYISQPAVSRHINNLEDELGVKLFNRLEKPLSFTQAGREYYTFFLRTATEFHQLQEDLVSKREQNGHTITVSLTSVWDYNETFQRCFAQIKDNHPEFQLVMHTPLPPNMHGPNFAQNEAADVLIHLLKSLNCLNGYQYMQLGVIHNAIFYSINHPLARKPHLTAEDFVDEIFLYITDEDEPLTSQADICTKIELFFFEKFKKRPKLEAVKNPEMALSMLEDGYGVMFRDEWARIKHNPKIRCLTLNEQEPVGLAWKRTIKDESVKIFVNEVVDYFQNSPLT